MELVHIKEESLDLEPDVVKCETSGYEEGAGVKTEAFRDHQNTTIKNEGRQYEITIKDKLKFEFNEVPAGFKLDVKEPALYSEDGLQQFYNHGDKKNDDATPSDAIDSTPSEDMPLLTVKSEIRDTGPVPETQQRFSLTSLTDEKPHACNICDRTFKRKNDLVCHVIYHTGEKPFKCKFCGYACVNKGGLNMHLKTHINEKIFACHSCNFKSIHESVFNEHISTHMVKKPQVCVTCGLKFASLEHLQSHLTIHSCEKPFKCDLCDFRCRIKNSLDRHRLKHSNEKPHACDKCDCKAHSMRQSGEKPFKCMHTQTHSENHLNAISVNLKPYECNVCDFKCTEKNQLYKHEKTHGVNRFVCDNCNFKCKLRSVMEVHMLVHTHRRKPVCRICGLKFITRSNLKRHIMIHTYEKSFNT